MKTTYKCSAVVSASDLGDVYMIRIEFHIQVPYSFSTFVYMIPSNLIPARIIPE